MRGTSAVKALGLAMLLVAAPRLARAQTTAERLANAVSLYQQFNVEAARPILLNIISPGYLQPVTSEQKATAFKYLGASYVVLATSADSARNFFIAALDFDPFTDLEQTKFAAAEIGAFNEAKARIFKIGIKALTGPKLIVPQSQSDTAAYVFRLITTQRTTLRVELINSDSTIREILWDGPNDGARGLPWRGVLRDGGFAPPGVYALRARATQTGGAATTESMNFQIEHIFEALEDTLPALDTLRELLPERINPTSPWLDLIKGGALATAAITLPLIALNSDVAWAPHAGAAAAVGLGGGFISFSYRRKNPQIPENVLENTRRRNQRAAFNAAVRQRNRARLDRTLMIISPMTGFGR